jgi:hypothetical protein
LFHNIYCGNWLPLSKKKKVKKVGTIVKKIVKKVVKKLSKSCQKVDKKLSKSCQKVVKNFVSPGKNQKKVNRPENKKKKKKKNKNRIVW